MDENFVRLETWCSAARQLFIAAGRISSGHSSLLLKQIHADVLRSLHGPHGVALVNGKTSLMTLPDEILRQILLHAELHDRFALAAACKHLRERCNALAVLGPIIHVRATEYWDYKPSNSSLERAVTIARQSLPADLESVTLTWWPELNIELSRFLSGNLTRIHFLNVCIPFTIFHSPHCARALFAALAAPAPLLTELHLGVSFGTGGYMVTIPGFVPIDAFVDPHAAHHLSCLRRLCLSGVRIPLHTGLVFAGVREFCWLYGAPKTLTRDTLLSLTACFPSLETLRIRTGHVSWVPASLPVRSSLRHVHVDGCDAIDDLAGFLDATRIQLLTLTHPGYKKAGVLLESLVRLSTAISYSSLFCEFIVRAPSATGLKVTQAIRYLTTTMPVPVRRRHFLASLRYMTCLSLLELLWPQPQTVASGYPYVSGPPISLPALTSLRVSLATCRSRCQLGDAFLGGILLGLDDPLSPLQTPALQNLEISYFLVPGSKCVDAFTGTGLFGRRRRECRCRRTLSVSLCDIHRFVTACVRLPKGRRLEHIRIDGVEVVDLDPFPYMELLEQLATVVSVSPVPKPNNCDLGVTLCRDHDHYTRLEEDSGIGY